MPRPLGNSARDRLNLYLALVPFVLRRGSVSVDEVADHFGVRRETIIDAMTRIACDGGANEARSNYYTELFQIDWDDLEEHDTLTLTVAETLVEPAPFSARQRALFLAGLEILAAHPMYNRLPEFAPLVAKLRGSGESEVTTLFGVSIEADDETATSLQDAIEDSRRVRFTYTNNQGTVSTRDVDPYRIDIGTHRWYLKGYCYEKNQLLTFALDSIEGLTVLDEPVVERPIDPLRLAADFFAESENDTIVTLDIEHGALPLIASYRRPGDKPVDRGDAIRLEIPFTWSNTAVWLVSSLPGVSRVIEPADVRSAVVANATAALAAYRDAE